MMATAQTMPRHDKNGGSWTSYGGFSECGDAGSSRDGGIMAGTRAPY